MKKNFILILLGCIISVILILSYAKQSKKNNSQYFKSQIIQEVESKFLSQT